MTPRGRWTARLAAPLACLAALLGLPPVAAAATAPPEIQADNAIVVEGSTGEVLFSRRPDERVPIASATKLMTALITLERARLSERLPASDYDPAPVESQLGLDAGEQMTVADLLRALLLVSANDAAMTLAEGVGGSRERFVRLMNRRARELELQQTRFENPIGLDNARNRSSAGDLVALVQELRTHRFFRQTVARERATLDSGNRVRRVENRNEIVSRRRVDGIKTGYTRQAEYVLVASGRNAAGVRLITVVLGEPTNEARYEDTLDLLSWGFRQYRVSRPVRRGDTFDEARVPIRYRRGAELSLMAGETVRRIVKRDAPEPEIVLTGVPMRVEGPVRRGQRIGRAAVELRQDGAVVTRVPLVASTSVPAATLAQKVKDAVSQPYALTALLVAATVTALAARTLWRRRRPLRPARAREAS